MKNLNDKAYFGILGHDPKLINKIENGHHQNFYLLVYNNRHFDIYIIKGSFSFYIDPVGLTAT